MRFITAILIALLLGSIAHGERVLREITWDKAKSDVGEVIPGVEDADIDQLKITNTESKPLTARIVTFEKPGITKSTYAVRMMFRYEGMEGTGYLEMWSVFPDGSRYFTRTPVRIAEMPTGASSGWHDVDLPFNTLGARQRPVRLEINLVLRGKGTVYFGPLRLVESPKILAGVRTSWWDDPRFAWLGPAIGIFATLVGVFIGFTFWLAKTGRARRFVRGAWYVILGISIGFMILARIAQTLGQPGDVRDTLLLTGAISCMIAAVALIVTYKAYERWEFRRMIAQDAIPAGRREKVER